jgi:coenzyme PQQ precursor peptide PqqA
MIVPYGPVPRAQIMASTRDRLSRSYRRHTMKWETPEAIDMRFGMEITMYISNR